MNPLRDIFLYFVKFPKKAGVLEMFNRDESELYPDYSVHKAEIEALETHSLIPGIEEFVFGVNEDSVKKRIQQLDGPYLFIDYGHIMTTENQQKVQTDEMLISLTVAIPHKIESQDMVEQVLMADDALKMLLEIRSLMEADSICPFVKQITLPIEITPFFARELSDSTGWTMVFKKQTIQ